MPTTSGVMVRVKPNGAWRFHASNTNFTVNNYGANANLEIRIVSDFLSLTTLSGDTTPNAITFTAANNVNTATVTTSNSVTITGINVATPISISNGGSYSIGNSAFVSTSGTVLNNQTVRVRITSSNNANTTVSTTLTVGTVSSTFSVRTAAPVVVPWTVSAGNGSVTVTSAPTPAVPTATAGDGSIVVN